MRLFNVAALVAAAAISGSAAVASAAPKDYCADLKGTSTGTTCAIQLSDPAYTVDISIPLDYPDQQPIADYISQTRDTFINAAKGAPHDKPSELKIKPTEYSSAIPPRGTQTVVFNVYQNVSGAQPRTTFKAFNYDQTYRKQILYTAKSDDKKNTPLWRVDDPLKTVGPIVQAELQKQQAPPQPATPPAQPGQSTTATAPPPLPISPTALYDPANYQNFAVVNEGVIFFFDQGALLPDSAGAVQVLVPRSAIDPMLA
ncbi:MULTISPECIES: esterase [Mycobacterium]|uniref:Immunogenic protein MPT64 n=1 Tax=Mycobacterium kiyosense TaxID=2871094 RepID=A0AA37V1M9_9MYCO|nr:MULTISPECIES: esterase [Mycobacterium]BDB41772.1 immunogenic protein MPT64 precursor [Mycobacterium kiyosense]BDE14934.1 immunogenic protein MPT64 precursor [Mycobacterium sp. 20KCMC460]GLB82307.1 immunogenic protein MPT64 precursor [Mycobacterium kiyosense]GLB89358.1 immunogenic protein MPT64 precursor [Mycobacterium kiyosense]GLB96011.1 immunogenic protein MPT64 precursor [Mycobacterium kiyosense]